MKMDQIAVGDFVKALRDGQRMWFQVMSIDGAKLTTMLDNEPITHFEFRKGEGAAPLPIQPTLKRNDVVILDASEIIEHECSRD